MAIYKVKDPEGNSYTVEGPEGASDEEVLSQVQAYTNQQALTKTEKQKEPSLGERFKTGLQETVEGLGTTIKAPFLSNEELTQRFKEHQANQQPSAGDLEKVGQIYRDQGILAAGKEALSQIPGAIADQGGNLGVVGAGALGGAALGSAVPVIGTGLGALAGAGSALFGISAGSNIERQISEQLKAGEKVDPNLLAAYGTAALQAGIDVYAGPEKFFAEQFGKVAGKKLAQQFAEEGLANTLWKGVAKTAATEGLTEVGQQGLERAQAGLPITGDEANKEYVQTAYQTLLASPIGAPIRMYEKGQAQSALAEQKANQQAEEAERQKEQEVADASHGQTTIPGIEPVIQPTPNIEEAQQQEATPQSAAEYLQSLNTRFTNPSQIKNALEDTEFSGIGPKKVLDIYKTLPKQESLFGNEGELTPFAAAGANARTEANEYYQAQLDKAKAGQNLDIFGKPSATRIAPEEAEQVEQPSQGGSANLLIQEAIKQAEKEHNIDKANELRSMLYVNPEGVAVSPEQNQAKIEAEPFKQAAIDKQNALLEDQQKAEQDKNSAYYQAQLDKAKAGQNLDIFGKPSATRIAPEEAEQVEQPSQGGSANLLIQEAIKQAEKEHNIDKANELRSMLYVNPEGVAVSPEQNQAKIEAEPFKQAAIDKQNALLEDQQKAEQDTQKTINDALTAYKKAPSSPAAIRTINGLAKDLGVKGDLKSKVDQLSNVSLVKKPADTSAYSTSSTDNITPHTAESLSKSLSPEMKALVQSGKAVIHDSAATLPGENHPANVQGMTTEDGVTHYVANKLTPKTLQDVALHEMGVHIGMEKMVGAKVWENLKHQAMTNIDKEFDTARAAIPKDTPKHLHAEEALAYLVEKAPHLPLVRRIVSSIRNWARTTLGVNLKLTEADARHLATKVLRKESKTPLTIKTTKEAQDTRYSTQPPQNDADLRAATQVYATPEAPKKETAVAKATKVGKYFLDNPISHLTDDLTSGLDKLRTAIAHSGSPIQREYQTRFKGGLRNPLTKEISGHFLMDQAADYAKFVLAATEMGTPVIKDGVVHIEKNANNLTTVQKINKKLATRLGSVSDANHAVSAYLQAQRYQHLLNENAKIQRQIDALGASAADKRKALALKKLIVEVTPEQAAAIPKGLEYGERHPEVKQLSDVWMHIKNGIVDFQEATGVISKELADKYRADSAYVPLYRIMDDMEKINPGYRAMSTGVAAVGAEKHFTGSDRDVQDIFANMFQRVAWGIQSGMKNHANQRIAKDFGVANDKGEVVYHNAPIKDKAATSAPVWVEGKQKWVEYSDPSFVTAIKGIEPIFDPIVQALSTASKILRMSVTSLPMFQVLQIAKDAPRAAVESGVDRPFELMGRVVKDGFSLYYDMLRGKENEIVKKMARAGITGGYSQNPQELADYLNRKVNKEASTLVQKFLDSIEKISSISDLAQRKAVYEQTLKETGDETLAEDRARNIINWSRHGANPTVRVLAQTIPFMNAYIQSMDVLLNTMNGTGISAKEKAVARKEFYKTALNLSMLSFVYAMAVAGDDEYEKMNEREKINNIVIPGFGKIPIASEIGFLFKAFPEMLYQKYSREGTNNPMDDTKFKKALWDSFASAALSPNMTPQLVKPPLEATTNHSFLTGNELVGPHLKGLDTALQYNESTSELGKLVGSSGLISPIKVDHLIKGYGGTLASLTLMITDAIVDQFSDVKKPTQALYKNPIIGAFVNDPRYKDQIDGYYGLLEESNKVASSLKEYKDRGNITTAKEYIAKNKPMLTTRSQVLTLQKYMTDLREHHSRIVNSATLSPDEKREKLDKLEERMGKLLRNINTLRVKSGL